MIRIHVRGRPVEMASVGSLSCAAHGVGTRLTDRCRFRLKRAPSFGCDDERSGTGGLARMTKSRKHAMSSGVVTARSTRGTGNTSNGTTTKPTPRFGHSNKLLRITRSSDERTARVRALDDSTTTSSLPSSVSPWRRYASVTCVMLAVFLHLLGFTVTGPITPQLVNHFGLHPSQVGYLTSAYPLGMFFALFAWPRLSDKVGRKPILALSLCGVGCGLVAQSYCIQQNYSLYAFLGLRVASGAFAGASPIVKAYLADIASEKDLPKFMAWREACCTLAFIAGPTLGGWFFQGTKSLSLCIGVTGYASVVAAMLVTALMVEAPKNETGYTVEGSKDGEESDEEEEDVSSESASFDTTTTPGPTSAATRSATRGGQIENEDLQTCPLGTGLVTAVATICVVSFLYNAGQSTFDSFFPVFCSGTLHMGVTKIGATLTSLAAISFAMSAFVFSKVQEKVGLTLTAALGLTLVALGLLGVGMATSEATAIASAAIYVSGIPLFTPAVPILLMQCVPKTQRGAVMGLDSAVNAVARIATPILFGKLYQSGQRGAADPFLAAGGTVLFAAFVVVFRRWSVLGGFTGGGKGFRAQGSAR